MRAFLERLRRFTALDPACGSGNFLYLALHALKDIEHRVQLEAEAMGLQRAFPAVGPANVKGIEINAYAAELARVSVWIGEIQWMRRNGFRESRDPILKPPGDHRMPRRDPRAGRDRTGLAGGGRGDRQSSVSGGSRHAGRLGPRVHRALASHLSRLGRLIRRSRLLLVPQGRQAGCARQALPRWSGRYELHPGGTTGRFSTALSMTAPSLTLGRTNPGSSTAPPCGCRWCVLLRRA